MTMKVKIIGKKIKFEYHSDLLVGKEHAFALTGRNSCLQHTQGNALGYELLVFQAVHEPKCCSVAVLQLKKRHLIEINFLRNHLTPVI